MGCLWAVVISVVVGIALVVGGGYYAMMHTSLPFKPFIQMVNASGDAEIKGFEGSLSSGFSADEFRVFTTGKSDTYFEGISFKYNGARDFSGSGRFIIEEFAIKKAFISLPPFGGGEEEELRVEPAFHTSELDEALDQEQLDELGVFEIKSIRIDEFVIENSEGEQKKGSVMLADFKADKSGVTLGDLKVTGDYLEMKLDAAPEGSDYQQVIHGAIKSAIDRAILKDISFSVEFGGAGNASKARYAAFDGKLTAEPEGEEGVKTIIKGLTTSDYLDPKVVSVPAELNMVMTTTKKGNRTEVEGGDFLLGKTRFKVDAQALIDGDDPEANKMTAIAAIGGKEVVLRIAEPDAEARHFTYEFSSDGIDSGDLPAQVLFHKSLAELNDDEKEQLNLFASRHLEEPESETAATKPDPNPTPDEKPDPAPGKKE